MEQKASSGVSCDGKLAACAALFSSLMVISFFHLPIPAIRVMSQAGTANCEVAEEPLGGVRDYVGAF